MVNRGRGEWALPTETPRQDWIPEPFHGSGERRVSAWALNLDRKSPFREHGKFFSVGDNCYSFLVSK